MMHYASLRSQVAIHGLPPEPVRTEVFLVVHAVDPKFHGLRMKKPYLVDLLTHAILEAKELVDPGKTEPLLHTALMAMLPKDNVYDVVVDVYMRSHFTVSATHLAISTSR